jgi:hypothetical protein
MRTLGRLAPLITALALACGGDGGIEPPPPAPPPSGPGPVSFDIAVSTGADHGAVLFTVTGGVVDSVTGLAGYQVFHTLTSTGARGMAFGSIVNGPLVQVWVPDRAGAAGYAVRVDEGAVRGTWATLSPESYSVARAP